MASTPLPTPPQAGLSISGSELPPQHHEVECLLTRKAESPIVCPQNSDFLSPPHITHYYDFKKQRFDVNLMARISFLVVMAVFFAAGCAMIKEKIRLANFEEVSKAYEHVMLDSDFESAYGFTNPDVVRSETDFTAHENIKILEYQVKKGQVSRDKIEVNQSVKIKYYRIDSPIVRTLRYEQLWKYDDVKKTWLLQTGLPEFK
jgi:hypothetical protein